MSHDFPPGTRKYFIIIGVCFLIIALCMVVDGATFNLTAQNVTDRSIIWTFDNDTYNISLDNGAPVSFTGTTYVYTNLYPDTMHVIALTNATNTTTDVQTTKKDFWDTDYFYVLIFGVFMLLVGIGRGSLMFLIMAWFALLYDVSLAWAEWGATNYVPIFISTLFLMGGTVIWWAKS